MALIYPQNSDLTKSLKSARKKVPQSARLSAGGCNRYLGNAQIEVMLTSKVLPLLLELRSCAITDILIFNPYVPDTRKEEEANFLGGSPLPHISLFAPSLYIIKCQLMSSVVKKQI